MTHPIVRGALVAALLCMLHPGDARADSACVADAQKYCAGVAFGDGRVYTCLQSRFGQLSSPCQKELQAVANRARQISSACAGDVWQFCQGVPPGKGRIRACLWSRWDELSTTCRDEAARLAEKAQKIYDDCGPDIERLCSGIEPGGGRIYLCLKAQDSKVSSRCRSALR